MQTLFPSGWTPPYSPHAFQLILIYSLPKPNMASSSPTVYILPVLQDPTEVMSSLSIVHQQKPTLMLSSQESQSLDV